MKAKTKLHKLLSLLLTLTMVLGMLPAMSLTAFAAVPGISLSGGDSDRIGTGWSYVESTKTLTLTNYNGGYIQGTGFGTLNLVLEGTSTITVDDENAKGIALDTNQSLNISGSGSLTINATGGSNLIYGIECNKFTMTSGTVTINANSSRMVYGVNANDSLSVTGGTLTANISGTTDGRGLYCKTGKLTVDSGAEVAVKVTNNGSSIMYGIYNNAYAGGADNGDIALAGTVTVTRDSGSTGSGNVYGIANSSSGGNTDGVISITGGSVTVTNAYYGIAAFTKGHDAAFADVDISGGTVNITSTTSDSLGIVSWNNGVTISGGTVTANTASSALWLFDQDSDNKTGLVKITGDAKVSLTSTAFKALIVQGDENTSSTRVHQINLTSGGSVTVKSASSDYYAFPVQGYFSLGSSTKITEGSLRSTGDGINAGGGRLFQADSTTKQVVVAYSTLYTDAGAVSVNGHSFASDKLYYKNGGADTTNDSTGYNAHYDPATGILELKNYNSGPIIIGGSNAYDVTVKLTETNTVTTNAPIGGVGNVCAGINITNADNVTFIGDGTLTVITDAGSGLTQVFGIWLDRSAAAAENLTFQSGKVTVSVTATDTDAQVFGVSTVNSTVGGPITVAEGAELNVTLSSASIGLANGLRSKGDITLNGKTAITQTYTGSGSPNASNWTSVSGFLVGNKLNVGANAAITVDMPDTYSLTNGMGSAYYAAKSDSQIGSSDWTNTTASEQYFENDSFLVTRSVKSGYGYADYKYEVITPLTFEDKADYDIPAGTKGTGYTATVALTATGGSGEYRYEFEGTMPSDLSINTENKLVYTRSSLCGAATATVKVTDKGGISKSITIDIGAVTAAGVTKLDKPKNLVWEGTTAKWDAVTGANKYRVILLASEREISGGYAYISNNMGITNNSMDYAEYMLPGMYYYFEVAAYNSANQSETFSDYAYSDKKQMPGSIGTVTGFAWSGNTISWTAVEGATGYDVWVMKDEVQKGSVRNVLGTSLDLTSDFESGGEGTYYVSVSAYKLASGNYLAEGNSPAKIIGATPVISAAVGNVTVNGTVGTAITETQVAVDLTNDIFEPALSGNWITNLPAGLSQSVTRTDDTHAKITVTGTPTAVSSEALVIKIPAANLVSSAELNVTANANAKYNITAAATSITDTDVPVSNLTGKTYNESAQEPTFGGSLIRDTDYTVSYAVKSGSTGALDGGKPKDAGTYVVTVTGIGSYTGSFDKDFKIEKANPVYTAPTAKTGLAYTGSAQALINSGVVTKGGEMQYKLDSGSYSTGIPFATDAGNYTVYFKIDGNDNYNAVAETQVGSGAINIAQVEWSTPTETLMPVNPTTAGGNDGQITGTTSAMQYKKSTESGWTNCSGDVTGLTAGTYYVRYKADSNHTASDTNYKTVTLTDPGATLYGVTVTDGTAAPTGNQAAGTEVTITANAKTGFNFKEWTGLNDSDYKTGFTKASNPATFIMPASAVNVMATFKPAALTGTASITGTLKFNEELTASLAGTNNTGTLTYKWYRSGEATEIATNNTGTYTLVEDDIGKTITVKVSSDVQTGEISGSTTGTIEKADGPAAPTAFTLTFTPNSDGTTFTATIPTVAGGEYSFDGTNYSATNTKADCAANSSYTGYVRIAETSTHKASTATSSTQTSPKLTVATPTFTPNGASGFTGTQSVTISCATTGAKIHYTTDGTEPTASSTEYTTALSLSSTTTVKAIAVKAGMNNSAIATATFTKYSGGSSSGGGVSTYAITVDSAKHGDVTVSPRNASKDTTVTLTVEPDKGYTLETITVTDKNGDEIALTNKGDGKYTFKMPAGKVYVEVTFMEDNSMLNFFVDVFPGDYYYDAVLWAAKNGITGGVDAAHFAPNATCTRAQVVTFLWRAAGSPAPKNSMMPFTDVPAGSYYEQAVLWAVENGITDGTSATTFSPDAVCSRGQIVTFLWRSQKSPASDSVNPFADVAADAYYNSAVLWAVTNGITDGTSTTTFSPAANCTRAQIVTFLYRCLG